MTTDSASTGHLSGCAESPQSLRFLAAGCVPSSGDKSDKEESAGGFRGYGDFGLRQRQWMPRTAGHFALRSGVAWAIATGHRQLPRYFAFIDRLSRGFHEGGRIGLSGVYPLQGRVRWIDHAASSHGGARDFGVWPRLKVSMTIMAPPHSGHCRHRSRSPASF